MLLGSSFNYLLQMLKRTYATVDIKNLCNKSYVNGSWVDGCQKLTFDVRNPRNNEIITEVACLDLDDVDCAINAASEAFNNWKKLMPRVSAILTFMRFIIEKV